MADQPRQHRSLREISHLFLSSVREKQAGNAPRPQRKPPPAAAQAPVAPKPPEVDLTPEELEHVFAQSDAPAPVPPVKAIIASHLGPAAFEQARRYARHVASGGKRVGLIVVDAAEFRLVTFEPADGECHRPAPTAADCFDVRAMREAISELNCDLDLWLLLTSPRLPEGRKLLRQAGRWVMLTAADREGVLATYKKIKSLAEPPHPELLLAVIDAEDEAQAEHVFSRIAGAAAQFLDWQIAPEPPVQDAPRVAEFDAMLCQAGHDKAQLASAAHWQVVEELLAAAKDSKEEDDKRGTMNDDGGTRAGDEQGTMNDARGTSNEQRSAGDDQPPHQSSLIDQRPCSLPGNDIPQVIDLAGGEAVVPAVMRHSMTDLIECPVRPPMCPEAILAVSRERRLVLIASAGEGLTQLKAVGRAYRWASENLALLAMAMPQFSLDRERSVLLRLVVDQDDLDAEALSPLFEMQTVSIHAYRRVRWGQKTGLLLNAA